MSATPICSSSCFGTLQSRILNGLWLSQNRRRMRRDETVNRPQLYPPLVIGSRPGLAWRPGGWEPCEVVPCLNEVRARDLLHSSQHPGVRGPLRFREGRVRTSHYMVKHGRVQGAFEQQPRSSTIHPHDS